MDVRQLECFKTVVEEGSILRASIKLNISQPPLSRMMKELESELKTTLFLRGKNLVLTETGRLLYERACSIVELRNNTLKEVHSLEMKNEITLNIGIVSSSIQLYSYTIKKFHQAFPKVRFTLQEANTYQLIERLNQKIIDLAIVRTPFDTSNFTSYFFEKEPMIAITEKPLLPSIIQLEELSGKPLIIYQRFKNLFTKSFKEKGLEFNSLIEVDDAKTAILLSKMGLGIAIIPQSAYKIYEHFGLSISKIEELNLYTSLGYIYRKDEKLKPSYLTFTEYLKQCQL